MAASTPDGAYPQSNRAGLPDQQELQMTTITYVAHDGTRTTAEVQEGCSVMEGAVANGVEGIEAVCGGACACATCHVYVGAAWLDKLDAKSTDEDSMLDFASNLQPNSRLSCQIRVSAAIDGMIVEVPGLD
jgi:2Fe-2S ferredoxin